MTTPDTTERLRELAARLRARTVKKYTMILDDGEIERHSGTITQHLHPDAIEAADTIDHLTQALDEANARAAALIHAEHRSVMANVRLGGWMSAALDDPNVCEAMKVDIQEWFSAGPPPHALYAFNEANARADRERAAVVAWLRKEASEAPVIRDECDLGLWLDSYAHEIERGEHLHDPVKRDRDNSSTKREAI
jgi:hypothetical protein